MNKYRDEPFVYFDEKTGIPIRRVTSAECINHHPFFTVPAYSEDMSKLFFVSHRTGSPQIYYENRATGEIIQITQTESLNEWSLYPSPDGEYVYYTAGRFAYRSRCTTGETERFTGLEGIFKSGGDITVGMGTTALSPDGKKWAVRCSTEKESTVMVIDTTTKKVRPVLVTDEVSHMQFCPWDDNILFCAGKLTDRVWILNIRTGKYRRLYRRNEKAKQWITHEIFLPGRHELALVDWNKGILGVDVETGKTRRIVDVNAWHAAPDNSGKWMVADTNFPDIGIILFRADMEHSPYCTVCISASSNLGAHWAGPFPYDDGPITVYAPQHTHPHPRFSPDGNYVVYTSDKTGTAQVYEADIRDIKRKFTEEIK